MENYTSSIAFVKGSDFESVIPNPYAGMARTVNNALNCYGVHQRTICMESQRTLALRRRVHDIVLLKRLAAMTVTASGDKTADRPGTAKKRENKCDEIMKLKRQCCVKK